MSKADGEVNSPWEKLYALTPTPGVPFFFGGCRPVLTAGLLEEAGFVQMEREFLRQGFPSEIVTGRVQS